MESVHIKEVANILIKDQILIKKWTTLKDFLGLEDEGDFVNLDDRYKLGTVTSYALFTEILTRWKSAKGQEATMSRLVETLENLQFKSTAEKLQAFNMTTGSNTATFFEIDDATWNFVGRTKEIEELTTWFRRQNRFIAKVIGMGGIGKSELVKKFANTLKDETNGIWLNGDTKESITNTIVYLANRLGISTTNHNQPRDNVEILSEIISAIKKKNKFTILIIIDNVDVENKEVHPILKKVVKLHSFAIVTSRNSSVVADAGKTVNLDILETEDAQQLVRDSIEEEIEEDINKLCISLNNFPLALQQAVAYVNVQKSGLLGQSFKIQNYLKNYDINKVQVLAHPLNSIEHEYEETTLVVWNISIEQIRQNRQMGTLAIELLSNIAYFNADGICLDFIKAIFKALIDDEFNEQIFEQAIFLIKSYSLIKCENNVISIHRLVQEVTRVNCSSSNQVEFILRQLVMSIQLTLFELKQCDMAHVISLWKYVFKHDRIVRDFSSYPYNIIIKLDDLSLYREALEFSNLGYVVLSKLLDDKNMETVRLEGQAAFALSRNGKYEEGLQKCSVVYDKQSLALGKEHQATLVTGHDMASVLYLLTRNEEALKLYKTVLKSRKKVLGENDQETITTKAGLAAVLASQGKQAEAMKLHEEVLEWQKTELGEDAKDILTTRHNIGMCLFEQNKFTRARGICEDVLELEKKVLGEEHSSTLATKYMLAGTLASLGESEKGLEMMKEVLISREKVLGLEHPDTIATRKCIEVTSLLTIQAQPAATSHSEPSVNVSDKKRVRPARRCAKRSRYY